MRIQPEQGGVPGGIVLPSSETVIPHFWNCYPTALELLSSGTVILSPRIVILSSGVVIIWNCYPELWNC